MYQFLAPNRNSKIYFLEKDDLVIVIDHTCDVYNLVYNLKYCNLCKLILTILVFISMFSRVLNNDALEYLT